MSSQLNEFQNATVGMVVGVIEVRHRLIACDLLRLFLGIFYSQE